ncbi:unnamed protein product, partial [Prorocentrum cordatum]
MESAAAADGEGAPAAAEAPAPASATVDLEDLEPVPEGAGGDGGGSSSSRSRSRSARPGSSSSSSSRSPSAGAAAPPAFTIDDWVKVVGLESEAGKALNGRRGVVVQFIEANGRYEVKFGADQMALLRPDKLERCEPPEDEVAKPPPKAEAPKSDSLAALLGAGRQEEPRPEPPPKEAEWSVWARSAPEGAPVAALTEEQRQVFLDLQSQEEQWQKEEEALRRKVAAEFAAAGIFEGEMIEQAFQEQLERLRLRKLLRGPSGHQPKENRRRKSRSSESSSSSSSR